jgi:hypothetical protein
MNFSLENEIALIRGRRSFLLVGKAQSRFSLCIETSTDEYCQGVDRDDIIVVSAPEGGPVEPGIMLLELVRKYHTPLLVLPKDHPGSKRLSNVVSVGPEIQTNCAIRRGTHPEQHLVCANDELSGITIIGTGPGIEISFLPEGATVERIHFQMKTVFS